MRLANGQAIIGSSKDVEAMAGTVRATSRTSKTGTSRPLNCGVKGERSTLCLSQVPCWCRPCICSLKRLVSPTEARGRTSLILHVNANTRRESRECRAS
ncbi:hypothetical protein B0H10DRAFT_2009082, partial [Mycena sp. CBHHK59/15]